MSVRFFTGGINHETNTFSPVPASMERFREMHYARGQDLIDQNRGTRTVIGGFIDAAEELGIELAPMIHSFAMPSAAVTGEAWEEQISDTLDDLEAALAAGQIDGLLLGTPRSDGHRRHLRRRSRIPPASPRDRRAGHADRHGARPARQHLT
ncbi:MAG: M81 family metallopeptidase [Thermomicrobiales bacterium]